MTALNLWQCDTCARTYAADVAKCTATKCTGEMPMSMKERMICDVFRREGLLDALLETARQLALLQRGEDLRLHRFNTVLVVHTLQHLQCEIENTKGVANE